MKSLRRNRKSSAFTLIELLVVILIIAILAAMIVPRIINRSGDAKQAKALSDISALRTALDTFRLDVDRYPATDEGIEALRTAPEDAEGWNGPYLTKPIAPDPWGTEYIYESPGQDGGDYDLFSLGADRAEGGEGEAADIF